MDTRKALLLWLPFTSSSHKERLLLSARQTFFQRFLCFDFAKSIHLAKFAFNFFNINRRVFQFLKKLFNIFILHQTTTRLTHQFFFSLLFNIFILHQTTTWKPMGLQTSELFNIFILHQTTTFRSASGNRLRCLISLFYIKPQLLLLYRLLLLCCLISLFYIKPQPNQWCFVADRRCLISLFYIKPQQILIVICASLVV